MSKIAPIVKDTFIVNSAFGEKGPEESVDTSMKSAIDSLTSNTASMSLDSMQ